MTTLPPEDGRCSLLLSNTHPGRPETSSLEEETRMLGMRCMAGERTARPRRIGERPLALSATNGPALLLCDSIVRNDTAPDRWSPNHHLFEPVSGRWQQPTSSLVSASITACEAKDVCRCYWGRGFEPHVPRRPLPTQTLGRALSPALRPRSWRHASQTPTLYVSRSDSSSIDGGIRLSFTLNAGRSCGHGRPRKK
jgi:hypothetical protein